MGTYAYPGLSRKAKYQVFQDSLLTETWDTLALKGSKIFWRNSILKGNKK